jgi:hypothetical protein
MKQDLGTLHKLRQLMKRSIRKSQKQQALERSAIQAQAIHSFRQAVREKGRKISYWQAANKLANHPGN